MFLPGPDDPPPGAPRTRREQLRDLERILKALGNVNRLELVASLRQPRRYTELRLAPSRASSAGRPERPIARQAVRKHLAALKALGIVRPAPGGAGTEVVLDHARLFAALEQLRVLTQAGLGGDGGATVDLDAPPRPLEVAGPHLVLVRGVGEGRAFPLHPETAGAGGAWVIGRRRACAVALDYDPYVSGEHARVLARDGKHFLLDLPSNRNGTLLNWRPLARGGLAELRAGDVVGVGRSLLVFRGG